MPVSTLKYTNGEVTVVWKPDTCIHSRICWTELRAVFDPAKRPWVNMQGGTTEQIIEQVRKCPSGALSYFLNDSSTADSQDTVAENAEILNIKVQPDGPLLISTGCHITHRDGSVEIRTGKTSLCRCGASGNKPFCDGSHKSTGFTG
jgi:uncharacterized Fe-S cluster protein YjdI